MSLLVVPAQLVAHSYVTVFNYTLSLSPIVGVGCGLVRDSWQGKFTIRSF